MKNNLILSATFATIISLFSLSACCNNSQQIITKVKPGIEVLRDQNFDILKGKRVGLITNPTGVDSHLKSTIDILHEAEDIQLVALFAPEHGVRGDVYAGDHVDNTVDPRTGVPMYSIFGKTRKPTPEMLENVDVIVYDIQDIGCRSYTFISTMGMGMMAAAENDKEFVVLDRPNPLGGNRIEGNLVEDDYISFVSQFKIPYLYGQTPGELAIMLNEEGMLGKKCKLTVIPMEGWTRDMTWDETGLEWIPASPHIPYPQSAIYYPVTGILGELYFINMGVGYPLPFQTIGAPWFNADSLATNLNALNLPGVRFRPIHYKPYYSTSKGELCGGVQIYITDYEKARLTEIQFYVMQVVKEMYPHRDIFKEAPQNRFQMFDKVCGTNFIREKFSETYRWADVKEYFEKDEAAYRQLSSKYYLYK